MSRRLFTGIAAAAWLALVPQIARAEAPSEARRARSIVASIARHAAIVQTELRFARTAGDRARTRCLNAKLSEIHAHERLALAREIDLGAALARGDGSGADNERVVLSVLQNRARALARQAQACGRFRAVPSSGYQVRILPASERVASSSR